MCFSLAWLEQLIVWIIIVSAIVAIIKLVLPWLGSIAPPIVVQILMIVLWAVVAIMVVYFIFGLFSCLLGGGGGLSFPRLR